MTWRRGHHEHDGRDTVEDRIRRPAGDPSYALVLLFGHVRGVPESRRIALGREPFRLGRETDDDIQLGVDDPLVSRRHAEIHWSETHRRHWVRDLGSRNGVHLNGARVSRQVLQRGDVLRIGDTVFGLAIAEPDALEPAGIEPPLVGRSVSLRRSLAAAARVAASTAPVLVLGPTGTGKELIAAELHRRSQRTGPLVPVNCAALPSHLAESELFGHEKGAFSGALASHAGLFRAARYGTLFLDEAGELAPEIQAKLLRVLDARSIRPIGSVAEVAVDVRVVAATNRDLVGEVSSGRFRGDLYARLSESVVRLDPLRERPEDLEPLWQHFVAELGDGVTIELSGAAFEAMALHGWPFNVRELRQVVRGALARMPGGGRLAVEDLPAAMRAWRDDLAAHDELPLPAPVLLASGDVPSTMQLRQLVEEFHGNVKDVAAFLGKDRKQIYRWLRRDQIDPDAYRPSRDQQEVKR